MKRSLPKYCYRKGRARFIYYERAGQRVRMPDDPASAEFAEVYARLRRERFAAPAKRTIKALIANYMASDDWDGLAKNTRKSYLQSFRYLEEKAGDIDPAGFRMPHVIAMRDALRATPTTANRRVGALSVLFKHARSLGWVTDNPAHGVKALKGKRDPRQPWPINMIAAFRETADPLPLLIFELLLGTGQRIGDVLAMQWGHIEDGGIGVRQSKTGAALFVPFTRHLRAVLAQTPRRGLHIVTQENGRPVSYNLAWKVIKEVRDEIGAETWDIHCLRHTAASELAALGLSDEHIMSITGHSSREMAKLYAGAAAQKARAKEAQGKRK